MKILVIGVGSPFGDDRVGWEVVRELEAGGYAAGIRTCTCDRPGAGLVGLLQGEQHVLIVDAARDDLPPGTLRWLDACEIEAAPAASTHGFGLAEALALARALGTPTQRIEVLAVTAEYMEGDTLSAAVRAAVPGAAQQIRARLRAAL